MWKLIEDLGDCLRQVPGVTLAIENTVRTSRSPETSLTTLSSISLLLTHFPHPAIALCLDLAHLHLSELDLNDPVGRETLFELLKRLRGRTRVIHVGDSCSAHGGRGERHSRGHLDVSSIRAILRHPLLRGIPTQLETPPYYRGLRHTTSTFSKRVSALETLRTSLERDFVQKIVNVPDEEWALKEKIITQRYFEEKKRVEDRIYKIMEKLKLKTADSGGHRWGKWKRCRDREVAVSRKVQGMKRRKKRSRACSLERSREQEGKQNWGKGSDREGDVAGEVQVKLEKL
ncbi:hypothetical protein I316_05129 [Kwoniella heveanensis BCC8398]|uniref:Xylose isomerase-like TIM barrel domain-containing protein n=1 Tax=Kwoniella heveanensis BCC8398 TaxID=1296120 RepID=A0A1B9GPQ8_9TREE|nr:hypothetical protein I316_05129 [Kwoniella heveanensis BCC8398]